MSLSTVVRKWVQITTFQYGIVDDFCRNFLTPAWSLLAERPAGAAGRFCSLPRPRYAREMDFLFAPPAPARILVIKIFFKVRRFYAKVLWYLILVKTLQELERSINGVYNISISDSQILIFLLNSTVRKCILTSLNIHSTLVQVEDIALLNPACSGDSVAFWTGTSEIHAPLYPESP